MRLSLKKFNVSRILYHDEFNDIIKLLSLAPKNLTEIPQVNIKMAYPMTK